MSFMAQNLRQFIRGELFFLGGVGIALIGGFLLTLIPAVYYILAFVGLALSLYGAYVLIIEGIFTGTELAANKILSGSGIFLLVGFCFYLVPFVLGWPIMVPLGQGQSSFFGLSLILMYNGLLQMGLALLSILVVIPDVYRQLKMKSEERIRKPGQVHSYQAIVAAQEPMKEQQQSQDNEKREKRSMN
jgi:hypothetical protein